MRNLIILMILFVGTCSSSDLYLLNNEKRVTNQCGSGEPLEFKGYCADCFTQVLCDGDVDGSTIECDTNYACSLVGEFSACVPSSEVAECQCPGENFFQTPDPYDNQKYISWVNCEPFVESCPQNGFVSPFTGECIPKEPTEFPITDPPEACTEDVASKVGVSCTSYRFCTSDGTTSKVLECEPGEYFDRVTDECARYLPFTCSDKSGDGYFGDPLDCSKFYLCSNGEQIGATGHCPTDQVFNNGTKVCSGTDTDCVPVEDCGICKDNISTFPIDCQNYYQCADAPEGSDLDYAPIQRTCPDGFYFDPESGFCSADVTGCP